MDRSPQPREQRKAQTRERLLSAARKVFVEKGFASASVKDIVEAAGYTRGAFYSTFGTGNKSDLLLELLRRDHERTVTYVAFQHHGQRADIESLIAAYCCRLIRSSDGFSLWVDAMLHAARESRFRYYFNALRLDKLERIGTFIDALSKQADRPLCEAAERVAIVVLGMCEGLQLCSLSDPHIATDEIACMAITRYLSRMLLQRS
ncbi:TetR/AcrR family transcriptional regulator [Trinickia symbiotica]|uniref:TetR/AcrR family transcriptional regulator n=1 Tax=Trinickia symbiotica TaxID=863227 RepID=UPI00036E7699|nr:TetR/AcrR family transcriptional regulator [Trinickia symbiotica]